MDLIIEPKGRVRCLYDEGIDLTKLGPLSIRRASHVEPDVSGRWFADLNPMTGPVLGPFLCRSEALAAERAWIQAHRLTGAD